MKKDFDETPPEMLYRQRRKDKEKSKKKTEGKSKPEK